MTINQPYFVFLYDAKTQTILFQGRIVDPSSAQ
jgi:serine protease inhibitor